ncbi:LysR family transcriptional regulator [Agrobacterium tumefaciens]|uniref:HTH-type transcriptional regulator TtuA n=1 Tax=Agrobacterium tumefaciens TaxID=358 RepID=A0AA44J8P5_AGRTU|nr:LysR family transcriptional regulator [Agrobacterium tumefaciens]NSL19865.1 LysR family transcriptional regulator [Agrobacterium tumefaciens]NTB88252.1 LysR family transcriptional regulator [Agrobacterium tumefaciens]NTC15880.1 LysR family transcriptional regulator [Agrobacterium tumefaciens]NTC29155.1 LysR family transcriptional regulator [Agrobacterium tumefaciens]NTC55565.1 LysR family transcriptional regulator [Agrobacterium tumefaciens]
MVSFEDMQTFVEVADGGGITVAARRLGLPKSIVSRRLVRLESELGVQLLARTTRGASLTEAGASFREHAARMCLEMEVAREEMAPTGELRGRLRVAVPSSFGPRHFAPALAELARQHPLLQLHAHYSDRYVDLVAEGFDCGIRVGYLQDSNLTARKIGAFAAGLFANPEYLRNHGVPRKPSDLLDHQAILQGTESWKVSDGSRTIVINAKGRFKADSALGIAEGTAAGLGIAALPVVIAESYVAAGTLVPIMSDYGLPEIGVYIVRPPGSHVSRKVRVLIDFLVQRFAAKPGP